MCDEFQCFKVYSVVHELSHSFIAVLLPGSQVCGWLWWHLYLAGRLASITVITVCIKQTFSCFLKFILLLLLGCQPIARFLKQFFLAVENLWQLENYLWLNIQKGWRSIAQKNSRYPLCSVWAQRSVELIQSCCCWLDDAVTGEMCRTGAGPLPAEPALTRRKSCGIHGKGILAKPEDEAARHI